MAWRGRDTLGVAGAETRCGAVRCDSSWVWASAHFFRIRLQCHLCHVRSVIIHFYIYPVNLLSPPPPFPLSFSLYPSLSVAFLPSCPFFCHTLKAIQFLFNFNWLERLLLLFFLMPLLLLLSLFAMQIYSWFTFKKLLLLLIRTHTQTHTR